MTTADHIRAVSDVLAINPLNPRSLLQTAGQYALWIVIFAETGLLVGFFLPGDTILFLAGVASSPVATAIVGTKLPIIPLLIVTPICAVAGAQLGYLLGAHYGIKMFNRPNSRIFKREYVDKTEQVFLRFGAPKAVVLARFIPIVRTFLNPVAGILEMPARRFFIWNVVGGVLWVDGILLAGHGLAKQITNVVPADKIDNYLLPIIVLIVLIAAIPLFVDVIRRRQEKRRGAARGKVDAAQR